MKQCALLRIGGQGVPLGLSYSRYTTHRTSKQLVAEGWLGLHNLLVIQTTCSVWRTHHPLPPPSDSSQAQPAAHRNHLSKPEN